MGGDAQLWKNNEIQKLNLGCGLFPCVGEGWINVDKDPTAEAFFACADAPGALFRQSPAHELDWIQDKSIDLVYASHLIEHYPPPFATADAFDLPPVTVLLDEIKRVMAVGGELWIAVPDLAEICNRILSEQRGREEWIKLLYGHHASGGDVHHWGYTKQTLGATFIAAGFWPCGKFDPFVENTQGTGFDCAGAHACDDFGNECNASINMRGRVRMIIEKAKG